MRWIKKGFIFNSPGDKAWNVSHAQVPKPIFIKEDTLRIYYGTRDSLQKTKTSYIDVSPENPKDILYVHDKYILELGSEGAFDDSGVMPACIIYYTDKQYLYYTGWNIDGEEPYTLAIGLAISSDGGNSFEKIPESPVIAKSLSDLISVSQPFVLVDKDKWRMWYSSFTKWKTINGRIEPVYNIKYAESDDGKVWNVKDITCLDYDEESDALVNPSVWVEDGIYKMAYSYRKNFNYRTDKSFSYRIGYAESEDGLKWTKKKSFSGLDISESGWDSEMVCYPAIYKFNDKVYMLYNGNGFGRTGFGYAVLSED